VNAGEVNEDGQPSHQHMLTRLSRVCGLIAPEKFEDLTEDEKNELFANSIQ
jgi:hypothetical protein